MLRLDLRKNYQDSNPRPCGCEPNTLQLCVPIEMSLFFPLAECGDHVVEDYPDHTYLSTFKFVPQQDSDLERRIMENHKKHAYVNRFIFTIFHILLISFFL